MRVMCSTFGWGGYPVRSMCSIMVGGLPCEGDVFHHSQGGCPITAMCSIIVGQVAL